MTIHKTLSLPVELGLAACAGPMPSTLEELHGNASIADFAIIC